MVRRRASGDWSIPASIPIPLVRMYHDTVVLSTVSRSVVGLVWLTM